MVAGQVLRVLVATQNKDVYAALRAYEDVRYDIALYTGDIKEQLQRLNPQLVIIDDEDIVEYPITRDLVRQEINQKFPGRNFSSDDFLADPEGKLNEVRRGKAGDMYVMRPLHLAFVSYAGGVGRTTLAFDTALYYASMVKAYKERNKQNIQVQAQIKAQMGEKPAVLIELTYGVSALVALTGLEMPSLYQLATQPDAKVQEFKGVTLIPMDYDNVRMLSRDLVDGYWERQMAIHGLTVVDCIWPHGNAEALKDDMDLWIVVACERQDAILNALKLRDELIQEFGRDCVWTLLNQHTIKGTGSRVVGEANEIQWDIVLSPVRRPDEFRGALGRQILSQVFHPVWESYDKPR